MSFLTRQAVVAALTANAVRPPKGRRAGVPAFFAGWLFSETAPQMLALTALDAATHLTRGRRSGVRAKAGLALAIGGKRVGLDVFAALSVSLIAGAIGLAVYSG